jgi:trigger factor
MTTEASTSLQRQVALTFPATKVNGEVDARLRRMARTVRLSGFRPGKVPLKIVAQQYGGQVRQEVLADGIREAFAQQVKAHNFRIAGLPQFEPKTDSNDESIFEFVAKFEVYPDIVVGDVSTAKIARPVTQITEADVDRTVEILRKQRAHYHPAERGAQKDDRVQIDYRGTIDGTEFEGGSATGQLVTVGDGRLLKAFEDGLLGMKAADSKQVPMTFPADYHGKAVAGKDALFAINVKEVQAAHLPEVNEDFAKALGVADGDIAKMRAEIRANLEREVVNRVKSRVKDQIMQVLLERTPVTPPQALVGMEIARMHESMLADLRERGVKVEGQQSPPPDLFREQATRRVSLGLIVAEIIKQQGLEAKPEQVRTRLQEHAQTYEQPGELVKWYYSQPERIREVEAVVAEDNVVDWILARAQVEDKAVAFEELMGTKQT